LFGGSQLANHKRKTVGFSFRIEEKWVELLREEAERQELSVNALMNKILHDYSQHWRWTERFGAVLLTQSIVAGMAGACPEEAIIGLAKKSGTTGAKDALRTMGITPTFDNVTFFIKNNMGKFCNWFDCSQYTNGKSETFHLRHGLGKNWSLFIGNQVATIFETILCKPAKAEIFSSFATIEVNL
jgi:hypothetical protein